MSRSAFRPQLRLRPENERRRMVVTRALVNEEVNIVKLYVKNGHMTQS